MRENDFIDTSDAFCANQEHNRDADGFCIVDGKPAASRCECGRITGERCEWTGPEGELDEVEWLPPYLRETVRAARSDPRLSSLTLRLAPDCAEMLAAELLTEDDDEE